MYLCLYLCRSAGTRATKSELPYLSVADQQSSIASTAPGSILHPTFSPYSRVLPNQAKGRPQPAPQSRGEAFLSRDGAHHQPPSTHDGTQERRIGNEQVHSARHRRLSLRSRHPSIYVTRERLRFMRRLRSSSFGRNTSSSKTLRSKFCCGSARTACPLIALTCPRKPPVISG